MSEIEIIRLKDELAREREKLNRIARAVKIEYLDYESARNMEMTIDLGENMRDQLQEVFRILQSEGIDF